MSQPVSMKALALELETHLTGIEVNQQKADCLLRDLEQSFFDKDSRNEDNHFVILYEYLEYAIKSQMASDYVFGIKKELERVNELYYELLDALV